VQWQGNRIVCACVSTETVSTYTDYCSLDLCKINALVVTRFKICLQFDFIWWDSPLVSASTGVLSAVVGRRRWGQSHYIVHWAVIHSYAANLGIFTITRLI
jgi:hypothetical protein